MSLLTAAAIVSVMIAVCCLLPNYFSAVRKHSRTLLFIGTAVLLGFVFFDLVPEMMEIGGVGSSRVDLQACKLEYSIVSPK